MTSETENQEKPKTKDITFVCKFCKQQKPLAEMAVLTRFFPPVVTCRDCSKRMQ